MPRPKRLEEIVCEICSKTFEAPFWRHRKVCSFACRDKKAGIINSTRKKHPQEGFQKGHKISSGENHPFWKGDRVGYDALHDWVRKRLGAPQLCEFCGITKPPEGLGKKKDYFEWANKSRKYKRVESDWLRLCVKCHKGYDKHGKAKAVNAHKRKIARIL